MIARAVIGDWLLWYRWSVRRSL